MTLREKINARMDVLQKMMEDNVHLDDPNTVEMQIENVSKFWSVLSEEDRDYIHGAKFALEEQTVWKSK
jgi:hypothetical protein